LAASSSTAVVVIAHGSRREAANEDVRWIARQLAEHTDYAPIEVAYLELAAPDIATAAAACVARGASHVLLLPYFLSAGTHVVDDLRRCCMELSATFPRVRFELCPPLGLHPLMLHIVRDRLQERLPSS
jgi:sirohydrochlorin ferrochelatase